MSVDVYQNGDYVVYQSEGSARYNLAKVLKSGKRKFIRGFRTLEEAKFVADAKERGGDRRLV